MPGSRELSLMWASQGIINTVSLAHGGAKMVDNYWSSRESNSSFFAWFMVFSSGYQGGNSAKAAPYAVRCLRAF